MESVWTDQPAVASVYAILVSVGQIAKTVTMGTGVPVVRTNVLVEVAIHVTGRALAHPDRRALVSALVLRDILAWNATEFAPEARLYQVWRVYPRFALGTAHALTVGSGPACAPARLDIGDRIVLGNAPRDLRARFAAESAPATMAGTATVPASAIRRTLDPRANRDARGQSRSYAL